MSVCRHYSYKLTCGYLPFGDLHLSMSLTKCYIYLLDLQFHVQVGYFRFHVRYFNLLLICPMRCHHQQRWLWRPKNERCNVANDAQLLQYAFYALYMMQLWPSISNFSSRSYLHHVSFWWRHSIIDNRLYYFENLNVIPSSFDGSMNTPKSDVMQ